MLHQLYATCREGSQQPREAALAKCPKPNCPRKGAGPCGRPCSIEPSQPNHVHYKSSRVRHTNRSQPPDTRVLPCVPSRRKWSKGRMSKLYPFFCSLRQGNAEMEEEDRELVIDTLSERADGMRLCEPPLLSSVFIVSHSRTGFDGPKGILLAGHAASMYAFESSQGSERIADHSGRYVRRTNGRYKGSRKSNGSMSTASFSGRSVYSAA